ncbi:MAG: methyl-accepting chemotaxis protein [Marinobacter sp.]|nr:methyl-accepting chemotaxis protein [Marinobacter sp.]
MRVTQFYSNLSIGLKLSLGFAVLIALSIAIGLVGLQTINSYGERSTIVARLGTIESDLRAARVEEKNFLMRGKPEYVTQAKTLIADAGQLVAELRGKLKVPADKVSLSRIDEGARNYSDLLDEVASNRQAKEDSLAKLEEHVRALEGRLSNEDKLYMANATLKQMRRSERNFLVDEDDKALKQFDSAAERALRSIKSSFLEPAVKDEVTGMFNQYVTDFHETATAVADTRDLEIRMSDVASQSVSEATDLQKTQFERMVDQRSQAIVIISGATGIVILLGALLAWLLTRMITRPINEAVDVATRVASGDLRMQVTSNRGDEMGKLLTALGIMVSGLRDVVQGINAGATNIASSAEELSAVTDQTSAGVTQQKDQTDQVATAMNEMVATVNEVARSAEDAFTAAGHASEKAASGERAVDETLSYVSKLNTEVEQSMARIRGLQTDTQNIGSVLDVIKSVAEQTNLLALNAAIEAARAGEQGRGFAVVADEVRSLAQRTQASAAEIETLITNLVSSAEASVKTMESGTTLAGRTLDSARSTGETIKEISQAVEEIKQFNSQIATAAEQQTSVAEDINQNVTLIRDVSDQSASSAGQVASASNELAKLGEDLKGQVARFTV